MPIEVKIPPIGESIKEAYLAQWLQQTGEQVTKDMPILSLETEKISLDVPAPGDGILEIIAEAGQTLAIGTVVAKIISVNEQASPTTAPHSKMAATKPLAKNIPGDKPSMVASSDANHRPVLNAKVPTTPTTSIEMQPPTLEGQSKIDTQRAHNPNVINLPDTEIIPTLQDLHAVSPTGVTQVIRTAMTNSNSDKTKRMEDIDPGEETKPIIVPIGITQVMTTAIAKNGYENVASSPTTPLPVAPNTPSSQVASDAPGTKDPIARLGQIVTKIQHLPQNTVRRELSPIRQKIAQHLVEAQNNTAMLTTFNEVDMTRIMELRTQYKEFFIKKYQISLGLMPFFIKASIEALKEFPQLNASLDGKDIIFHEYYHIGIAVGGAKGLVVPVIRHADRLSFIELEQAIQGYVVKAKQNQLTLADLDKGTFTISNGGVYGSLLSTPILNSPQTGILGMHKIQDRAVVIDKQIVIRPMMYLAMSYDHRMVDGRESVGFLCRIKECLEAPERMMLEI